MIRDGARMNKHEIVVSEESVDGTLEHEVITAGVLVAARPGDRVVFKNDGVTARRALVVHEDDIAVFVIHDKRSPDEQIADIRRWVEVNAASLQDLVEDEDDQ